MAGRQSLTTLVSSGARALRRILGDAAEAWSVAGRDLPAQAGPFTRQQERLRGALESYVNHRQRLDSARAQLAAIVDHSEDAIFAKSLDGIIQSWNAGAERLYGYKGEEIIGRPVSVLVPEEHRPELDRIMRRLRVGKPTEHIETVRLRKDGSSVDVSVTVSPLRDAGGRLVGASAVARDITRSKRIERTLRGSEERLRLALDAGHMGTWQWNVRTGEVVWSAALEAIHGLAPGSFPGTFEASQRDIHPEDRQRVVDALSGTLEHGELCNVLYRLLLPDGSVRWVEERGKLVRDEAGAPERMVGVSMDVTERTRAARAARLLADVSTELVELVDPGATLERLARLAVLHFADWCAVDLVAPDGTLERVAMAHGEPVKMAMARSLHERYPPDPSDTIGPHHVLRTGEAELVERVDDALLAAHTRGDEHLRLARELGLRSYIGVPLRGRQRIHGVLSFLSAESGRQYDAADLGLAREVAYRTALAIEAVELARELRERDRRKDEFIATLSHELRNPLAPIRNAVDVMRTAPDDVETRNRSLDLLDRQVDQLVRLVDDLLDVERVTLGKLELHRERVLLSRVLESAIETASPLIERAGQRLEVRLSEPSIAVDADFVRLAQVFSNLLTNASKYTGLGGRIELSVEQVEANVLVRLRDSGQGIAAEALPHIFDAFTQARTMAGGNAGGLGIGLALVKNLVELHGGTVSARSDGVGLGSEFVVRLPAVSASRKPKSSPRRTRLRAGRGTRRRARRVLVVDDNAEAAMTLQMLLEARGHKVRTARDGESALSSIEDFEPDLVLLDIGLPGLNGYEVARKVRSRPGHQPVLAALTGWSQAEDRRRSREAGFAHHFAKPIGLAALEELLESLDGETTGTTDPAACG